MRLNLNKTLRAALIAAITAVGTTLPQTYAETNTARIDTTDASLISWFAFTNDSGVTAGSKTTGWNNLLTFNTDGYGTTGADHSMNGGIEAKGGNFTLSFDINTMGDGTLLHMNTSGGSGNWRHVDLTTTSTDALTLTFKGKAGSPVTATAADDWSTVTITGNGQVLTMYINGVSQGTIAMSDATNWNGEKLTSIRFGSENGSNVETADLKNILIYGKALSAAEVRALTTTEVYGTYTWVGDGSANVWSTIAANWTKEGSTGSVPFSNDNDALFNSTGASNSTVSITEAVTAGTVTVDDAAYTFNIGAEGSLAAAKLVITGTDAKLTVNGAGRTLSIDALSNNGVLEIGTGATVSLAAGMTLDATHTLDNVSGAGTLAIQKLTVSNGDHTIGVGVSMTEIALNGGTLTFASGTSTVSGKVYSNSDSTTLVVGADSGTAVLKANRIEMGDKNDGSKHHDLTINAGGTLKITGSDTSTNYKNASLVLGEWGVATPLVTVKGMLIADKTHILAGDKGYTMNINGGTVLAKGLKTNGSDRTQTISISNNGKLILGDAGIINSNTHNGVNLTVDGGTIGIYANSVTIDKDITVSGAAAFDTQMYTVDDISVTRGVDGGTLTVSGNLTGTGTITKTGAGELILSGGANALGNTIQAQGGTLTMTGTFAIDGISGGGVIEDFVNAAGETATSGFARKSGTIDVYNEDGGTVNSGDATFTLGGDRVSVTGGVCIIDPTVNYTTLWVKDAPLNFGAYKAVAGDTLTKVDLAAGTSVNMDYDTASITLEMHGDATVNATAAATISSISGWENHTLNVDGTSEVTLANLTTLTGSSALEVKGGTLNTKKFVLNSADASLKVNDGTTMNVTGDLTSTHGSVEVAGAVNISGSLDLSNGGNSNVELDITSTGEVMAGSMWMAAAAAVALEQGGTFNIANMQIVGKDGGRISTTTNNVLYGSNNGAFVIENATITATGNVTIGNTLSGVDVVVDDGHTVTLNAAAGSVTVRDGGTINVGTGSITDLMIEEGGIVGSGVETSEAKIADGATAAFAEGLDDSNVYFYEDESGETQVQVTNNTGAAAAYDGIANTEMKVTAGEMIAFTGEDVEVFNILVVNSVSNLSTGALTINTIDTDALSSIENYGGQVTLQNVSTEPVVLENLAFEGSTVAVYTAGAESPEGTVTIMETLTAGGGTLLANLEMADGSKLDVNGGDAMALTLGSRFTIVDNALVTLDEVTLAAIAGLENIGDKVVLLQAYEDEDGLRALTTNLTDGDWSRTHFDLSSITDADYKLFVTDTEIGLVKSSNVPEPTTGTLSLLALAALAARRRKH